MQISTRFYCCLSGFRSKISILQALADITEIIRNKTHLDLSCMLFDPKKVFDTINIEKTLLKLESYGLRGICVE